MANYQLIIAKVPASGGVSFIRINVIDHGDGTVSLYFEDRSNSDGKTNPAAITATGNAILAGGVAGGVTGAGTTGALPKWTNGPGGIIGDSILSEALGVILINGILALGSGPTTISDAAGKILSAALNIVQIAQGGTGLSVLGTALQQLRVNAGATALEFFTPSASGAPADAFYFTSQSNGGLSNEIVWPGLATKPDLPPAVPAAADNEFDTSIADFTLLGIGGAEVQVSISHSLLVMQGSSADSQYHAMYKATTGATWTYAAGPFILTPKQMSIAPEFEIGMFLRESATGKGRLYGLRANGNFFTAGQLYAQDALNQTWAGGAINYGVWPPIFATYIKLQYNGVNILFSVSRDGAVYELIATELATSHFTVAPNQIGFAIYFESGVFHYTVDEFRQLA